MLANGKLGVCIEALNISAKKHGMNIKKGEKMRYLIILIMALQFSGCAGVVTGHVYTQEEIEQIRAVAKEVYKDAKAVKKDIGGK